MERKGKRREDQASARQEIVLLEDVVEGGIPDAHPGEKRGEGGRAPGGTENRMKGRGKHIRMYTMYVCT